MKVKDNGSVDSEPLASLTDHDVDYVTKKLI